MYYDLHIHSALSPCGDDMMTINNIFNMAYVKGLDLIAITDHNSLKQQFYLEDIINHDVLKGKIDYIHGVEIESKERIHILAYFKKGTDLKRIQDWLDNHLIKVKNDTNYYGNQYIFNELDEIIDIEDNLLLSHLDLDVYQITNAIHEFGGIVVLAHVLAKKYGLYHVYNDIPSDLPYDGIELVSIKELTLLKKLCPNARCDHVFYNSDAHWLEAINEPSFELNKFDFYQLWK